MDEEIKPHRVPVVTDKVIEFNFSSADTYLKCGKRYEFRFVKGIKEAPAIALIEGSSHHRALEENNLKVIKTGRNMKPKQITDIFVEDLRRRLEHADGPVDMEGNSEDKLIDRAEALHEDYIGRVAPHLQPAEAETEFEKVVKVGDLKIKLFGTIDLLEVDNTVTDYKTTSKSKSQSEVDQSMQGSLYTFARKTNKFRIVELVKKSIPEAGILESTRTPEQQIWALNVVAGVVKAVQAGQFPMTSPTNWWCSAKFCGYWKLCRGKFEVEK